MPLLKQEMWRRTTASGNTSWTRYLGTVCQATASKNDICNEYVSLETRLEEETEPYWMTFQCVWVVSGI